MHLPPDVIAQKEKDFRSKRTLVLIFLFPIIGIWLTIWGPGVIGAIIYQQPHTDLLADVGYIIVLLLVAVGIPAIYFLPTWIAMRRKCASLVGIFVLNALCGWWGVPIILLSIWAAVGKTIYQAGVVLMAPSSPSIPPSSSSTELLNLLKLKESGDLSDEEFESAKKKILG